MMLQKLLSSTTQSHFVWNSHNLFPQRLEIAEQFWEAIDEGHGTEPLAIVDGRVAADNLAGSDIIRYSALRGGDGSVADGAVTGNAYLSGENYVLSYRRGTCKAHLGTEECVLANSGAVAYLDEVIDLGSCTDAGLADGGTVNARVGLDFDGVFEDGGARLDDLVPGSVGLFGEAESVGPDDGPILQDDIVTDLAVFADDSMSVGEKIVSCTDVGVEHDVRQEGGVIT